MYAFKVTGSEFETVLPTVTGYPVEQLNGGIVGGVTSGIVSGITGGVTGGVTGGIVGSVTNGIVSGVTGGVVGGVTGGLRSTGLTGQQQQPIQSGVEGLWEQPEIVRGLTHLPRVLPFYAKTRQGLEQIMEHVEQNPSDLAIHCLLNAHSQTTYTPKVYPYRGFTLVNGEQKMRQIEQVEQLEERPVWFLFSGMGIEQWQCGMTREMMKLDSFRRSILKSCQVLRPYGINLLKLIIGEQEVNNGGVAVMTGIESFVYLTSVQIALVDCLRQIGVRPEGLIGQSIGELVCAYVEQCLTHEQTLMTSYYLAKCIQQAQQLPKSLMAVVGDLTWEQLRNKCPQGVVPVCFDSLDQFMITGPHQQVRDLLRQLRLEGFYVREIELPSTTTTTPVVGCVENFSYIHTQYMNEFVPVLRQYLECLNIVPKQRSSRWISTSVPEQKWSTPMGQLFNIEYLLNLLTSPVMLHQTLRQVPRNAILIEISPRSLVQTLLKKSLFQQYQQQQQSLIQGTPSVVVAVPTVIPLMPTTYGVELPSFLEHFLVQMGRLYLEGVEFDSVKLFVPVHLERTVYPVPIEQQVMGLFTKWDIKPEPLSYYYVVKSFEQQGKFEQTLLSGLKSLNLNDCGVVGVEGVETVKYTVDVESLLEKESYLLNHQINGRVLYPTTGYLYLVWKSIAQLQRNVRQTGPISLDSVFGQSCEFEQLPAVHFENVQIHRATVLREQPKQIVIVPENRRVLFEIRIQPTTGLFEIVEGKNLIVNGRVSVVVPTVNNATTGTVELNEFVTPFKSQWETQVRCNLVLSQEEIYKQFRQWGYEFNGEFQPIVRSNLQGTQGELLWTGKWIPFLDAMLQMNVLAQQQQQQQIVGGQQCLLPTRIRSVKINPIEHIIRADKYVTLPVVHDLYTNKTQCGSIEIVGLQVTPVVLPNGQFNPTINNTEIVGNNGENFNGIYNLTQLPTPVRSFGQWTVEQQQQQQSSLVGGLFNPRLTHVIVGALDCEFGFELAQWMVQFGGVRYLVLTTVRPVVEQFLTVEQIQKLRYLQNEFDCQIKVVSTLDLSEESECLLLIKQACRMTSHFEGKIGSLFHLGGLFVESKPVATTPALLRSFYHFDKLTRSSSVMPEYGLFVVMTTSIQVTPGQTGLQTVVESVCESRRRECSRHGLVVEWTGLFNVEFDYYPKLNAIQYKQAMAKFEQLIVKSVKIQFPVELQQQLWGIVESMTGYPSIESTSSFSVEQQQPKQLGQEQFEEIAQGKRLNRLIELLSLDFDFEQPEYVQGSSSSSVMIRSRRQVQEGEKQVYLMPTRIVEKLNDVEYVFGQQQQQQPLFVVLPIEGSIQMIKSWAQQLRVPVYGLQYTQECLRFETVEQLAQFYWQQIEIVFPNLNKFHLVGHTFGVPVAFEMALRRPQQVISLALLDSGLTQTFLNVRESTTTTGLTGVAVSETEALYRFYQQFVAPSVRIPVEQFYQVLSTQMTTFDERVKYVVGKIVEQSPFTFNLVDLEQTARSFVKKLIISARYVPTQPLRLNKILVVRPTIKYQPTEYFYGQIQQQEQVFEQEQIEKVFKCLRQFVYGKVQVYLVDGEQKTFLHGETGCRIASILNQHLVQF